MKLSKFLTSLCTLSVLLMMSGCAAIQTYIPIKRTQHNVQQFSNKPTQVKQRHHKTQKSKKYSAKRPVYRTARPAVAERYAYNPARRPIGQQPSVMSAPMRPRGPLPDEVKF